MQQAVVGGVNAGLKTLSMRPGDAAVRFARDADPASDRPAPVPYANGGGAFFRRRVYRELGGFAPVFAPYYWEDTDLGYRAWKRGYEIRYDPSRRLEHDHQGTIGRERRRHVSRIKARNQRLFLWRNWTDLSLPVLPATVCAVSEANYEIRHRPVMTPGRQREQRQNRVRDRKPPG